MRTQRCIAPFIGSLALAAAGCVLAWPARASLIAADSFSYTAGGPLAGSGTNASWPTTGRIWTGTGNTYMEIPGVDFTAYYGGLVHSGNVAEIGTGGTSTVMSRLFGTTYNTATASYWFSVMIDIDKDTSDSTSGMYLMNGGTQELFVGDVSGSSKWGMKVGANCEENCSAQSSTTTILNHAELLVFEIDNVANQVKLYIDPVSLGGSAPSKASAQATLSADFSFNQVVFKTTSPSVMDVDEFRFGTSYADVTPTDVPEPAVLGVLGLGMLWLAMARGKLASH